MKQQWVGAAVGAGAGLLGMMGQRKRENRQMKNQERLMGIQAGHQERLNRQGADLQYEMWQKTNYPAQMAMLKEAGLNAGLLYGQSGGGGTTTGSQGGGSAQGGSAPNMMPMELGAMISAAKAGAEIEMMKAQAKKAEAEGDSIRGEEGTVGASQIEKNLAEVLNTQSKTELNKLGLEIGNATKGDVIDKAFYEVEEIAKRNNLTDAQTDMAKEQVVTEGVKRQLMKAQINLSEQQISKMVSDVKQGWVKLDNELKQIGINNQGNKLRALEGKTDVQRLQQDFILGAIGKEIDLQKLNIEQQRIFVSLFNGMLNSATTQMLRP